MRMSVGVTDAESCSTGSNKGRCSVGGIRQPTPQYSLSAVFSARSRPRGGIPSRSRSRSRWVGPRARGGKRVSRESPMSRLMSRVRPMSCSRSQDRASRSRSHSRSGGPGPARGRGCCQYGPSTGAAGRPAGRRVSAGDVLTVWRGLMRGSVGMRADSGPSGCVLLLMVVVVLRNPAPGPAPGPPVTATVGAFT